MESYLWCASKIIVPISLSVHCHCVCVCVCALLVSCDVFLFSYLSTCDPVVYCMLQVEHIIREDYLVEAMEVVELYCDLLLARFGMLEQMMYCEDSLAESVSTLIWVAPRLSADIQELNQVNECFYVSFWSYFFLP